MKKMKNLFIIMMLLYASFLSGQIRNINENPFDDALLEKYDATLKTPIKELPDDAIEDRKSTRLNSSH